METQSEKRSGARIFGVWKRSDFLSWQGFLKSPALAWFFFLVGCLVTTLLLAFQVETLPANIRAGGVAPKDIKADQNYEIVDIKSTQVNREEAIRTVLPVYDYDEGLADEEEKRVQESFSRMRRFLQENPKASLESVQEQFEKEVGFKLKPEETKLLMTTKFRPELEMLVRNLVRYGLSRPIIDDGTELGKYAEAGVTLRRVRVPSGENELVEKDVSVLKDMEDVHHDLTERAQSLLLGEPLVGVNAETLADLASHFIRPNVNANITETEWRKTKAIAAVKPVIFRYQAGESIIRSGERYEPRHVVVLEGIREKKSSSNFLLKFIGTFFFVALLLLVTFYFAARYIKKFSPRKRDLLFMGANLIVVLIHVRLFAALASAVKDSLPFEMNIQSLYYAIPVAAGAMLTRLILNSETALVFGIIASALSGIFLKGEVDLSIFYLISSIAGAGSIAFADRRTAILKAGLFTGLINMLVLISIKMIHVISMNEPWTSLDLLTQLALGFMGGTNSALYVLFFTPVVESVFGYTTDVKLLELGNMNHPLLKEMIVTAPGTYHHSQLVAVLAEAAAESIGANPILARIGSYFHDIGKMKKPLYFIENQMGGENRHDKLAPSMSALIICSHVKDGIDLAEEHKLPKPIIDMIPQHQGTKLITFFYNKAKEKETEDVSPVKEEDYRYPGPRPQTREAGILLLADGVEAAVRSLPEKTPAKIQSMVQKIINKSFAEEQLEECDLTLRDLRTIADSFVRVLVGIYHQRIAYPDVEEKKTIPLPIKNLDVTKKPEFRKTS